MAALDVLGFVGRTIEQLRFDACVDSGGFGLVYRGRHLGLDEDVAIKCLRIAAMQRADDGIREIVTGRFRDETKLLYRLSQGNLDIVRCISSGTLVAPATNEITPYMVLEWLDGRTLSADLRERREHGLGTRSIPEVVELLDSAANALAYAHAHEVVHRDVKPGNLFLTKTREGVRVKVLDFGLAKILDIDAIGIKPSVETQAGVHFCSPSYGAPEQFSPKVGRIGPWTDVYSFTLVLLETLKGDKVRPASSLADGLVKALDPRTGSPTATKLGLKLPRRIEELLRRAVSINPTARPRDMSAFWKELRDLVETMPKKDMGATVADADVVAAMERVRKAQAARVEQTLRAAEAEQAAALLKQVIHVEEVPPPAKAPPEAAPHGATQPSPFAGTMLMANAPAGAPHLPPQLGAEPPRPTSSVGSAPPVTLPLAGAPQTAGTSPLASSLSPSNAPAQPPLPIANVARTAPQPKPALGPTPQPRAYPSSVAPQPRPVTIPPPAAVPPSALRTDPRQARFAYEPPPDIPKTGGSWLVALLVLGLLFFGGGGAAYWWFRMHK